MREKCYSDEFNIEAGKQVKDKDQDCTVQDVAGSLAE
jgi:hypothetical protein